MNKGRPEGHALARIRYKSREKDEDWILQFLQQASFGMLGTTMDDQPFVTPMLFVYDEGAHAVYFHSATMGRLRANIEANPLVCFTIAEMGRMLPAKSAKQFDVEYSSVMIFGEAFVVEDPSEALLGLDLLMKRYAPHLSPGQDYRAITEDELRVTTVFRLDIKGWSGKQNLKEGDPPGAFVFGRGSGA